MPGTVTDTEVRPPIDVLVLIMADLQTLRDGGQLSYEGDVALAYEECLDFACDLRRRLAEEAMGRG